MSNFGKCTVVIEGNAVKHVNDFLLPLCGKSDEYVCGKCFNVQSKLVDDVLYVNFESNWDLEILDKIIEICESESGRYYYNYYNESMLGDSESNDKEGKYFTKHEGYEKYNHQNEMRRRLKRNAYLEPKTKCEINLTQYI